MKPVKGNLLSFALAALLLFAQQAALTHEAGHASDHEVPSQQSDEGKHFHSGLCSFHAALAGVLGAVGSYALPLRIASNAVEQRSDYALILAPAEAVAPAARGPPVASFLS